MTGRSPSTTFGGEVGDVTVDGAGEENEMSPTRLTSPSSDDNVISGGGSVMSPSAPSYEDLLKTENFKSTVCYKYSIQHASTRQQVAWGEANEVMSEKCEDCLKIVSFYTLSSSPCLTTIAMFIGQFLLLATHLVTHHCHFVANSHDSHVLCSRCPFFLC